jgi:hypothetical protein
MSTNNVANRLNQQTADQKLADGLTKHAPALPSFLVAGDLVKTPDIIALLLARIASAQTVESSRATWQTAVAADKSQRAKSKALVAGVRQTLHVMFAGSTSNLGDFGLTPHKAGVVSPETRVVAAAKAKATRQARHTTGKKAKQALKGDVTGVVVTRVTAPPAGPVPSTGAPPTAPVPSPSP